MTITGIQWADRMIQPGRGFASSSPKALEANMRILALRALECGVPAPFVVCDLCEEPAILVGVILADRWPIRQATFWQGEKHVCDLCAAKNDNLMLEPSFFVAWKKP